MVNVEQQFICRVIKDLDLQPALEARIGVDHLVGEEHRVVYALVLEHWRTYGKVPARSIVEKNYPNWKFVQANEPMEYYVAQLGREHQHRIGMGGMQELIPLFNKGPDFVGAAGDLMATLLTDMRASAYVSVPDREIISTYEDWLETYAERAKNPDGLLGIATGFPTIDRATLGLQPEQFVLVIGPPAAGKSTLVLKVAANIVQQPAAKVLFIGFEMSNDEQTARAHAMLAGVSHHRLITGRLAPSEDRQFRARLDELVDAKSRMVLVGDRAGVLTVSSVAAKIIEHQPQLVVIDGLYLMSDEHGERPGSPQALTNITRDVKRLAQRVQLPILASTQALSNKMGARGVSLDSIGYSSSFAQDADVIIGIQPAPGDDTTMMEVRLLKVRSGPCGNLMIDFDWDCGSFRELSADE